MRKFSWKEEIADIIFMFILIVALGYFTEYIVATHGVGWALGSTAALIIMIIKKAEERITDKLREIEKGNVEKIS